MATNNDFAVFNPPEKLQKALRAFYKAFSGLQILEPATYAKIAGHCAITQLKIALC